MRGCTKAHQFLITKMSLSCLMRDLWLREVKRMAMVDFREVVRISSNLGSMKMDSFDVFLGRGQTTRARRSDLPLNPPQIETVRISYM